MSMALSHRTLSTISVVGVVLATVYAGFIAWSANWLPYDVCAALLFVPLILILNFVLAARAGARDPDPRFARLLMWALTAKIVATVARFSLALILYGSIADAKQYDQIGADLALSYRDGDFSADIGRAFIGTGFMRVATASIYVVTGQSVFVAYTIFSMLSFWGLYFFYRAFRTAMPDCDARRYALLVFFLPSMIYWPSSLGKEAWVTLGLGLSAYGAALLLSGDRRCIWPLTLGLLDIGLVRPHISALFFAGLACAYLFRRAPRIARSTPVGKVAASAVLVLLGAFVATHAADFLGVDDLSVGGVENAVAGTAELTDEGGSAFTPHPVRGPADFPLAAVTVLLRPFPFEAGNAQMLIASLEGLFLVALMWVSRKRLLGLPRRFRRQPYLLLCSTYVLLFIYAFSSFSNFGILTRERVMVLPFFLVLLALPRDSSLSARRQSSRTLRGVPA